MPDLLFDASSLLMSVKTRRIEGLTGQCVQWLTLYEVCNAVWKECHALRNLTREQAISLIGIVAEIVDDMRILDAHGSEGDVLEVALMTGLSVYDASYIVLAQKHGLTLVTEDRKLRRETARRLASTSISELPMT